jgi:hypothetical protein
MGALAEFERSLIIERVTAGIAAAKKRGKHVGRPPKLSPEQIAHARDAIEGGLQTAAGMAALLGVDHSTLWRAMRLFRRRVPPCLAMRGEASSAAGNGTVATVSKTQDFKRMPSDA